MHKVHPLAWQSEPTDFAMTHCMQCQAGWTWEEENGVKIIVCLSLPGAGSGHDDRLRPLRTEGGG